MYAQTTSSKKAQSHQQSVKRLLLVDDDETFCDVLSGALVRRGFDVKLANDPDGAMTCARAWVPDFALVDLRMPGGSGLSVVKGLRELNSTMRIVVLTGYSSVATAVEAIKLGATHYLTKPASVGDIIDAFAREAGDETTEISPRPMSVNRMEWEHVQKVLQDHNGNISAAARALSMHRRTLQRKLRKYPVKH